MIVDRGGGRVKALLRSASTDWKQVIWFIMKFRSIAEDLGPKDCSLDSSNQNVEISIKNLRILNY